jgi:hypothetical protein
MSKIKLGDVIPLERYNAQNHLASAEARGFNLELIGRFCQPTVFAAVQFCGNDASASALPDATVEFFTRVWDENFNCWRWDQVRNISDVSYYDMALIDGVCWCYAPAFFEVQPECPVMSFEEAEDIENKLLARAS